MSERHDLATPLAGRAVGLTLLALLVIASLLVLREARATWVLLGAHPQVLGELEASLAEQRELARLLPEREASIRQGFDRRQTLLQRLRIVDMNRGRLLGVLASFFVGLLALVAVSGIAVDWAVRKQRSRRLGEIRMALEELCRGQTPSSLRTSGRGPLVAVATVIEEVSATLLEERRRLRELESLEAWREGSRQLAHEMRTPMTAIRLDIDRLRQGTPTATELSAPEQDPLAPHNCLERIDQELGCLNELVRRFTASARLPKPKLEPLNLRALIEEFAATFADAWLDLELEVSPRAAGSNIKNRVKNRAEEDTVLGDPTLLRQALMNLVSNAHEAAARSKPPTPALTVRLSVHQSPAKETAWTYLDVTDNGPGIAESIQSKIFKPYISAERSDTGRSNEGRLGLGLPLSRFILLEHGGDLRLLSSGSSGTTFRLLLRRLSP